MTEEFDFPRDMLDELLDERTADAILSGSVDRGVLAPPLQRIAQLLDVARSPAVSEELADEVTFVNTFVDAMAAPQMANVKSLSGQRTKRRTAKLVAALAFVALSGTAAAAATNHLPDSIQTVVADAGSHVGVHLPKPNKQPKPNEHQRQDEQPAPGVPSVDTNSAQGQGPDVTGAAHAGLCTAHFARGPSPSDHTGGVAEQNLAAAAAAAGQSIEEFCADVVPPSSSSSEPDTASDASKDKSPKDDPKPVDPGKPGNGSSASDHPNNGKKPAGK